MPPWSVRIDPFLWLFDGKLGFELEVGLMKFLSVELVPVFVVNEQPPTFDYFVGREDPISRESDGIGPLAGTSIGAGFWLGGKPLEGTVLRVIYTNYGYHYVARDPAGNEFDNVAHVERRLFGYIGSHSKWGAFTLAGGFGLGLELNQQSRCFGGPPNFEPTETNCPDDDELLILTHPDPGVSPPVDLSGGLGGVQIIGRISLGVAFN
jgi:hypothetical protein